VAQFNVDEAQTQFSLLLEMAERGEDVIVARRGIPVARLVRLKSILGIGVGAPEYRSLSDELATAPLDLQDWNGE